MGAGYVFVQNLRLGNYELGLDTDPRYRLSAAFAELAIAI
jgi:IS6 family transposase